MYKLIFNKRLSPFFLFPFTLLLTLLLCLPWVSAKEQPKPKPEAWQINGIVAALDDGHNKIKGYAFNKLVEYDLKDLKSLTLKTRRRGEGSLSASPLPEIDALGFKPPTLVVETKKSFPCLNPPDLSVGTPRVTASLCPRVLFKKKPEDIAQKAAQILKDKSVDKDVRSGAAEALGNLGEVWCKSYIIQPDIIDFLQKSGKGGKVLYFPL